VRPSLCLLSFGCEELTTVFVWAWADAHALESEKTSRIIDLDVDIGADAIDYKYAFHHRVVIRFILFSDIFTPLF
jgi:hypothetical protein